MKANAFESSRAFLVLKLFKELLTIREFTVSYLSVAWRLPHKRHFRIKAPLTVKDRVGGRLARAMNLKYCSEIVHREKPCLTTKINKVCGMVLMMAACQRALILGGFKLLHVPLVDLV